MPSTSLRTLSLTLTVLLAASIGLPALGAAPTHQTAQNRSGNSGILMARLNFRARNIAPSRNRTGGASRGTCIPKSQLSMAKALLPSSNVGLTVSENPTLFVNLPSTSGESAEFFLFDSTTKEEVYYTIYSLPSTPGVVSFTLPKDNNGKSLLKAGKRYHWKFVVKCDPTDGGNTIEIIGDIERHLLNTSSGNQLQPRASRNLLALYAENGIWYATVATLAELQKANPNDAELKADWKTLLQSVGGLDPSIAQSPLLGSLITQEE
ncbi:MAG TPA: DUF928 domain-containing protein [Coleofasciculaceae cyanobacterium]